MKLLTRLASGAFVRIDAHVHLWRYRPEEYPWIESGSTIARDFLLSDLLAELAGNDVGGCVAVQARQSDAETRWLAGLAAKVPQILGVVGWVDLRSLEVTADLERAAPGIVGYRHVVQDEPDDLFLLDPGFIRGVRAVAKRGFTYDLLVNRFQLRYVPAFLDAIGAARIVLDHAAKPDIARGAWRPWATEIAAIASRPAVFCKISGLVTEADHQNWRPAHLKPYLDHLLECFGPERLIWGSDWPVCRLAASYHDVLGLASDYVQRRCARYAEAIFGQNASRAYGLGGVLK
jgi:L-fuconolactonase